MRPPRSWLVGLFLMIVPAAGEAAIFDTAFTQTTLASAPELGNATGLAWAPDGSNRLFVLNKDGAIRIIRDGALLGAPFATVTPLYAGSECGLIGIAFDPNFLVNQYVYVFATVSATEQQIIRYTADGDTGTAKTTVVPGLPTVGANHDGGGIGFGPDGKLYWAIGDLGNSTGANMDLTSLASKVGRANLDGTAPADNPFVDGAGPNADLIWARGFRNPFTLTFQPATGLLWVNDVGAGYEQIFIVRKGDHAGWTMYENNQPAMFITPIIKYRTNAVDTLGIAPAAADPTTAGAVRTAGTVTFTTAQAHGFRLGEKITVAGVADASFNGTHFVASIPGPTSFRAPQVGPDALSGGGTAETLNIGGCVTGGAFYDASGIPAPYRGNFFFADCNTGRIERVVIDGATNTVTAVDHWADGVTSAVDVALGPDGSLYYVGNGSNAVYRAAYNATAQGLVVTPTNLWIAEGDPAVVNVRLAMMPAQDTTVTIALSGGDGDIGVRAGGSLTFTPANWATPQAVTVFAGRDLDTTDDLGMVAVSSAGLTAETVAVHARDDNRVNLQVSTTTLAIDEGNNGTFTVALSEQPSVDVAIRIERTAGDQDVTVSAGAALTFTRANWATPQMVTVGAAADADSADDSATIQVSLEGRTPRMVAVTVDDDDPPAPDAAPDASATPDAGAIPDAATDASTRDGAVVADAPVSDAPTPDGSAATDTRRNDGGVPVSTGGGGCGCRTGDTSPAPVSLIPVLLIAALRARRRR